MEKITTSIGENKWLEQFFKTFINNQFKGQQKEQITGIIKEHYIKRRNLGFERNERFEESIAQKRFFKYLESIKSKVTSKYIEKGIQIACSKPEEKDFISSFIRYITITNFSDIVVVSGIPENQDNFYAYPMCLLGEYPLAEMELFSDNKNITFDNFVVNENVRRMGIGTLFFTKIIDEINTKYPEKKITAINVCKDNESAIKFYESLGFSIEEGYIKELITVRYEKEEKEKKYDKIK